MKNKINRELPDEITKRYEYKPFTTSNYGGVITQRCGPKVRATTGKEKCAYGLEEVIVKTVQDGMTLSFHHHFREGDYVFNTVMRLIIDLGYKNIALAPSSLTNVMNDIVVEAIEKGVVTHITSSGMRGKLGEAVSHGALQNPIVLRSHGGRARAIETGDIKIDVAFLGVPNADKMGNANGMVGASACGSLGYALMDAQYAQTVVLVTDHLVPYPNMPASIKQTQVDYVVEIAAVGNPDKIGSGATRFTSDPKELKIAKTVNQVLTNSPYFKDGFSFQTGTGGAALAVSRFLRQSMIDQHIKASFALGGITSAMVDLLKEGLVGKLMDVQDFDRGAAQSMHENENQQEIDASWYADPANKGAMVDQLDIVILSALEIDTAFNVNVMTGSDGVIRGAIGGHQDAATANLTIIAAPLVRGRLATIVPRVTTVITPGDTIDVIVTEVGIAINPRRSDLLDSLTQIPDFPIFTIQELQAKAAAKTGIPDPITFTDKVVAFVEYRDGTLIDVINQVKE